ncbi:hypothetical protein [Paenibacillus protaetiae]|uniref:Uncharacterized protein n=1 Tax=Paenibacillus protaetiae TaxID=2509456 RepID=A0A4V0YF01_9BACL|nr:hypothetical protein [Paenibacillus protaetiae]QAY65991.1 hypothetical protein ET464_05905 [Paenibacillus protaetiae]
MPTKRCVFCDRIVPVKTRGEYDEYWGCICAPEGSYSLLRDDYDWYNGRDYGDKRTVFPIISAYIRELTDIGQPVQLASDDWDRIVNSGRCPQTVEDKGDKLLHYLYRQTNGQAAPVVMHKLAESYNITYSMNLQELIYIVEQLKEGGLLERAGSTFTLTDKGKLRAEATINGKRLKPCTVLLPDELEQEWASEVLPKVHQCGYAPQVMDMASAEGDSELHLSSSKLVIAELTGNLPSVYWTAGYAEGLHIPVIWTVHRSAAGSASNGISHIRPIVWEDASQLGALLQQRILAS